MSEKYRDLEANVDHWQLGDEVQLWGEWKPAPIQHYGLIVLETDKGRRPINPEPAKEEPPACPKCGLISNMVKRGDEWVCHSTHRVEESAQAPVVTHSMKHREVAERIAHGIIMSSFGGNRVDILEALLIEKFPDPATEPTDWIERAAEEIAYAYPNAKQIFIHDTIERHYKAREGRV